MPVTTDHLPDGSAAVRVAAVTAGSGRPIPGATVARLPVYLQALHACVDEGVIVISSRELAERVDVSPAMLRKDLSHLGAHGTRGVGYDVGDLVHAISAVLGLEHDWPVAVVGVGNLGKALARYGGFAERGLSVAALFDVDPAVVGTVVDGHRVSHLAELSRLSQERGIRIAVLATTAAAAQAAADALVAAGVTSILNLAAVPLVVPAQVTVRQVDLSSELQILGFHQQRRESALLTAVPPSRDARTARTAGYGLP